MPFGRKLFGLSMVASMDTGCGLLVAWAVGWTMIRPVQWWEYGIAILIALFPDLDIAIKKWANGGPVDSAHRHGVSLHCPMLVVPICSSAAWIVEPFWGVVTLLCLLAHFAHDSVGEANEWGVEWFWPYHTSSYLLRFDDNWVPNIRVYTREEVGAHCMWAWIERWYLRPTWESAMSAVVLTAGFVTVLFF